MLLVKLLLLFALVVVVIVVIVAYSHTFIFILKFQVIINVVGIHHAYEELNKSCDSGLYVI